METDTLACQRRQNLGEGERHWSLGIGAGLIGAGVAGRGPSLALLAAGGYLVYRGLSGHCPLLARAGLRSSAAHRPDLERKFGDDERDVVEEASWQSFPASDPPAW